MRMKRCSTDTCKEGSDLMYREAIDNYTDTPLKLLILGEGKHGKDEFAARLAERVGLKFVSSSQFACEHVVFPWFDQHLPTYYANSQECFLDRRNWRALWHYLICQYNLDDKARLAREILKENDCYVGMRAADELQASIDQDLFTHIIWVDASDRVESEDVSSCSVKYNPETMQKVDNNNGLDDLQKQVDFIAKALGF